MTIKTNHLHFQLFKHPWRPLAKNPMQVSTIQSVISSQIQMCIAIPFAASPSPPRNRQKAKRDQSFPQSRFTHPRLRYRMASLLACTTDSHRSAIK